MEESHLVPAAGRPVVITVGFFDLASKVYTTSLSLLDMVIMKATKLTEEISVSSSAAQLKVAIPVAVASKCFGHKMMSPLKLDIEMKILYSFIVWHGVKCTLGDVTTFYTPAGGAPYDISVDSATGYVYAGTDNNGFHRVAPNGVGGPFGTGWGFDRVMGSVMDPVGTGDVLVAHHSAHCIKRVTPVGTTTVYAGVCGTAGLTDGPVGTATFYQPWGMAVSGSSIIVGSEGSGIRKILGGQVTTLLTSSLVNPLSIAADASYVYWADHSRSHIARALISSPSVIIIAGITNSGGNTDGAGNVAKFANPSGICFEFGSTTNLLIGDTNNHRIRRIVGVNSNSALNTVSTISGATGSGYFDGPLASAKWSSPMGIARNTVNGYYYVADKDNMVVRRIEGIFVPTGLTLTLTLTDSASTTESRSASDQTECPVAPNGVKCGHGVCSPQTGKCTCSNNTAGGFWTKLSCSTGAALTLINFSLEGKYKMGILLSLIHI